MSAILVQELADRLELHLDQLCDRTACQTPEHVETRRLIERARQPEMHLVMSQANPAERIIVVVPDPRMRA